MFSLICAWTNVWVNNLNTDDLRRHRAHYVVTLVIDHNNADAYQYVNSNANHLDVSLLMFVLNTIGYNPQTTTHTYAYLKCSHKTHAHLE